MKRWIVIVMLLTAPCSVWAEEALDKDFLLFMEYYEGEFNNHNQIYFQKELSEDLQHPWHHYTISGVEAPAFGENVFFAQINDGGPEGKIARQRVNVFEPDHESGTIRQTFYAIEPGQEGVDYPIEASAVEALGPDDLRGYPDGCQVVWRRHADQFLGTIEKGDCAVVSQRSGKTLYIYAEMVLSEDESWHLEGGTDEDFNPIFGAPGNVPYKLSRVRYFECWAMVQKDDEAGEWESIRDLRVNDQGGVAEITTSDAEPRHFRMQLMRTEFPTGPKPEVLSMHVFEEDAEKALTYAWTEPDADIIGLNLGWMLAECRAE